MAVIAPIAATAEHTAHEEIAYLWPCNVEAWAHWQQVQTQWRTGMSGATGLDYAGVSAYLNECAMKSKKRAHTFECIRTAEQGTLKAWQEKAKKVANQPKG